MFKYITDRKSEGGFTLVELMVVILIIAILLAVAIPVFLNARNRAVIRSAQQRLKQVVNAAKELKGGGQSTAVTGAEAGIGYEDVTIAQLNAELDTVDVVSGDPTTGEYVDVGLRSQSGDSSASPPTDTITFSAYDTNGSMHTAVIAADGTVTIN